MKLQTIYAIIFKIWRRRRMDQFEAIICPQPDDAVLDVGGYPDTWTARPQRTKQVDCINIHPVDWNGQSHPQHQISTAVGDGCELNQPDQSYDILFSNSVIEHVGDWDRQVAFALEARRVGKKLWIQTPAIECPFEPHFLAPFVHWLPVAARRRILRWGTPWGWLQRPTQSVVDETIYYTRLLRKSQFAELFPDCEIITERMLWVIPKSYVAYRTTPIRP